MTKNTIKSSKLNNDSELIYSTEQRIDQAMKDYFAEQEKTKNQNSKGKSRLVSMLRPLVLSGAIGLSYLLVGCDQKIDESKENTSQTYTNNKNFSEGDLSVILYNGKKTSVHYHQFGKSTTFFGVPYQGKTSQGAYEGSKIMVFDVEEKYLRGDRAPVVKGEGNYVGLKEGENYDVTSTPEFLFEGNYISHVSPAVNKNCLNIKSKK